MTELEKKKRRVRGPSAWGDFEKAKAHATAVLEAKRLADREKSERLRAKRAEASNAN